MFTFDYIWAFLLLPLPLLARYLLPPARSADKSVRIPFGHRVREASGSHLTQAIRRPNRWIFPALTWFFVVLALARPQWIEPAIEKQIPTRDLLLLVDISSSMQTQDFVDPEGKKIDRLTAVKQVVGDFLTHRQGDRVGLVVFGDAPYLQAPFSTDLNLVRELLDQTAIGMAGPRTAFGDAIGLGVNLFDDSDAPAKTIIALTDGNDTKSRVPPIEAARVAAQKKITIHTIAIGDPTSVGEEKLDEETLKQTASTTGGNYYFAANREELVSIYDELDKIETREVQVISHRPRLDLFYWAVLIALVFSAIPRISALFRSKSTRTSIDAAVVRVNPQTGKLEVSS